MRRWLRANRRDLAIVAAVMTVLFVIGAVVSDGLVGDVIVAVSVLIGGSFAGRTLRPPGRD